MIRSARFRRLSLSLVVLGALLGAMVPATAITGGTEDTTNIYKNVGMVVFYQPDGRFRCSGTLIAPRVVLTAAHCTYQDIGKVIVTFDPVIARTATDAERDIPRAADDSGPDGRDLGGRVRERRHEEAEVPGRPEVGPRHAADPPRVQRLHRPGQLERHRRHHPGQGARAFPASRSHPRTTSTSTPSRR